MELRDLPGVDALTDVLGENSVLPRALIVHICQGAIETARDRILEGGDADPHTIASSALSDVEAARPRTVINATGVLLHTNLGRAPLHIDVAELTGTVGASAQNVEMDSYDVINNDLKVATFSRPTLTAFCAKG